MRGTPLRRNADPCSETPAAAWMEQLQNLTEALTDAEPAAVATLLASTSDVTLVIGEGNLIRSVAVPGKLSTQLDIDHWPGRSFSQIVTPDTREIADQLLETARRTGASSPRAVVHVAEDGARIELHYAAAVIGPTQSIVLIGRTPLPMPDGDQGGPYGPVFEFGAQSALVVDGRTGAILKAGRSASESLGIPISELVGGDVFDIISAPWRREAKARLRGVMASGRPDRFMADAGRAESRYSIAIDRHEDGVASALVRFLPPEAADDHAPPASGLAELMSRIPDCIALLDPEGRIRWANEAFLAAAGLGDVNQAEGRPLDDFVAPTDGGDLASHLMGSRRDDRQRQIEVSFAGSVGQMRRGELSLAWLPNAVPSGYGAVISMTTTADRIREASAPDAAALMDMVGEVPLKDLVRDTTDTVERMCIEAALRLTGDNRAAAARALGLSRQALYLKLERYGLG